MSYCRFQNTLHDLEDCYEALQEGAWRNAEDEKDGDEEEEYQTAALEGEERRARDRLILLCARIADEFGEED